MISTRGRYAIRAMIDLARIGTTEYVPLKEIAQRQNISDKYLELILKELVKAELLVGHRGKHGGYKLTRTPAEYAVGEILELCEGTLAPVACLDAGAKPCSRSDHCCSLPMWEQYHKMVHDFFYGISLQDLLDGTIPSIPGSNEA